MKFDSRKHHRRSIRLKEFDYARSGAYFVTAVTYQREALFGEILNDEIVMNRRGEIVREEWFASVNIRKEIRLFPEEFVVMPNHIHGIVWIEKIDDHVGATGPSPLRPNRPHGPAKQSLSSFMAGFKSAVTKRIRVELNETGIWQRNFYERIIRNEQELGRTRRYIEANPLNWKMDEENLARRANPETSGTHG